MVLAAHPSLTGKEQGTGSSGSTGWGNAVRSRLYLKRDEKRDDDARVLRTTKANYARYGEELRFRWHNGVFVADTAAEAAAVQESRDREAEETFLAMLAKLDAEGAPLSALKGRNYAPTRISERIDGADTPKGRRSVCRR